MRRWFNWLAASLAIMSGLAVFQVKTNVQEKRDQVASLARQIEDDQRAIRMLRAEWAYLTSPSRLQDQSLKFLALEETQSRQLVGGVQLIPYRPDPDQPVEAPESIVIPMRYDPVKKPERKKKRLEGYQQASFVVRVGERSGR